jgi:hypothetical protein
MNRCLIALGILGVILGPAGTPGLCQETRADVIASQQQDKAQALKPYVPAAAEEIFERIERGDWFFGPNPKGFYPYFDSVYPGGGFALGLGYRKYFGYDSHVDLRGLYAISNSKRIEVAVSSPRHAGGRLDLGARAGWLDATRVPYYGLGPDSDRDDRANARLNEAYANVTARYRPRRWLIFSGSTGYREFTEKEGAGREPSIERVFTPATAPRLGTEPAYLHSQASAAVLWLRSPGYSRSGGLYRFTYEDFHLVRGGSGRFGLTRGEIVQHIPILRETWVVSLRARGESVVGDVDRAAYFTLPALGSAETLRGFEIGRFRDRHSLLFTGEWRWMPNRSAMDMALFVDAGKVASRRTDLTLSGLETDIGLGVRFHGRSVTAVRLEVARSHEGWRAVVATSAPF